MKKRLAAVRAAVREEGSEATLLTFLPDIRWACGFTGSNGVLVVLEEEAYFVTDGRYAGQARQEVEGARVHVPGYNLYEHIEEEGLLGGARRVLFQSDCVTVHALGKLRERFPEVEWQPAPGLLTELVASKDEGEIEKIRAAQRLTEAVFNDVLGRIAPGKTEREIAAEIVYGYLRRGAEKMAFDPIVASGPNGALPHARPTGRVIEKGDLVVLDMGGYLGGYASDMTRTVAVGEPSEEGRAVYELVREAQEAALRAARAGMTNKALDAAARGVIESGGHGEGFPHGLGHGVGLRVHEWPRVSHQAEEHDLPKNAVVTIEPGVYVPGKFGVRIEDLIVLREGGCENLTTAPKELLVLE